MSKRGFYSYDELLAALKKALLSDAQIRSLMQKKKLTTPEKIAILKSLKNDLRMNAMIDSIILEKYGDFLEKYSMKRIKSAVQTRMRNFPISVKIDSIISALR